MVIIEEENVSLDARICKTVTALYIYFIKINKTRSHRFRLLSFVVYFMRRIFYAQCML